MTRQHGCAMPFLSARCNQLTTRQIRLAWDGAENGVAQASARLWVRSCTIEAGAGNVWRLLECLGISDAENLRPVFHRD
jgi:hypothetical protein